VIARCNSSGDLYPFFVAPVTTTTALTATAATSTLWHRRLGHLGSDALSKLISSKVISCNKCTTKPLCHAYQLGRHIRLPFSVSTSRASKPFDLIHYDLWTSPIISVSGYKYYLAILDDCTHYTWTFPLRLKSETFATLSNFFAYARTQFGASVKAVQCDNGREFDHSSARTFFLTHGTILRMSCRYTSQQNGRAERILRTINNIVRSLLFQASLSPAYWADTLHTATYLLNRHPTKTLAGRTPYLALFGTPPSYGHLRVFGCACYPNLSSTATHKFSPRSTLCVFLGYSADHKGYRCLDLHSNRIIVSRHVVFDESSFPFANMSTSPVDPNTLTFLGDDDTTTLPIGPSAAPAGTSAINAADPPPSPIVGGSTSLSSGALSTGGPGAAAPEDTLSQADASSAPSLHRTAAPAPQVAASGTKRTVSTGPLAITPVANAHSMRTRGKSGFTQPVDRLNLSATALSPLPASFRSALADSNWRAAMQSEFDALKANDTWTLVPRPPGVNIITGKWVYRHKFLSDGTLDRYKARWVLRGFTQRPGIDYDETFSPVVKPATVRVVLTLALSRSWPMHQLDVKNAFLHGQLTETVYCAQPSGFLDSSRPDYVCRLNRSLYGLKQAPRALRTRFASFLTSIGFVEAKSDASLFTYHHGSEVAYLLLYVDDIVLTASS
jgi:hypothetical protein